MTAADTLSVGRSSIAMVAADSSADRDGNPYLVGRLGTAHSLDAVTQPFHLPGPLLERMAFVNRGLIHCQIFPLIGG